MDKNTEQAQRDYRELDSITQTKGGHKVKELFYIAATNQHPAPGIIGRMWHHHAYRDTIWQDNGQTRHGWGEEFDLDLSQCPPAWHPDNTPAAPPSPTTPEA